MKDLRVLIVDDIKPNLHLLSKQLQKIGFSSYNIIIADNGFEAIHIIENEKIDLVITDNEMPRVNGLDLIRKMKENPKTKDIPFILNSGKPTPGLIRQVLALGASFYAKPASINDIEKLIKKALNR
ncbi:MAG: response regulator [Candidatus Magasanikbacteria bacterium]|nr:response regulator [Candidatus Magasanikbacteria bacterium]